MNYLSYLFVYFEDLWNLNNQKLFFIKSKYAIEKMCHAILFFNVIQLFLWTTLSWYNLASMEQIINKSFKSVPKNNIFMK